MPHATVEITKTTQIGEVATTITAKVTVDSVCASIDAKKVAMEVVGQMESAANIVPTSVQLG